MNKSKRSIIYLILFSIIVIIPFLNSCYDYEGNEGKRRIKNDRHRVKEGKYGKKITIPDFDYSSSVTFEKKLSNYNLFLGTPSNLQPTQDFRLLELSSVLYTDYAKKQRLVKVPTGKKMSRNTDGSIDFPNGIILAKTFYYYNDERDTLQGKRIIETRLLIKELDVWNIATYLWNEKQTDASLLMEGLDTPVNWINTDGISRFANYHVPDENECIACHQSNNSMIPLGTTLRNLNRNVTRNDLSLNQITHLQSVGVLNDFNLSVVPQVVDYNDASVSLANRARAYLDLNCSHCHHPNGWEESARKRLDLRYETPLSQSGILKDIHEIKESIVEREMPFIGTTLLDKEGVSLIVEYIESL